MAQVLIIDDDEMICSTLALFISSLGHQVESARSLREGREKLASLPDLVFLDVYLPDGHGLEAIPEIRNAGSSPEVIIITGEGSPDGADLAIRGGAWDYVEKPLSTKEIRLSMGRAIQYRQQKSEALALGASLPMLRGKILGNSPEIGRCLEVVGRAAGTDSNVLITGETGTGKDLFARAIHENSSRSGGSFIVVDCAALPPSLVESVLFGHERGSFTGADQGRVGLVRHAHEGTLFLDEVGELPPEMQKKFLRVLQERRYRPVGGSREVESHFRLVAATNRNLEEMARAGTFREDLLFRLRVLSLHLPPLRERQSDIAELVRAHLDRLCERYQMPMKGICPGFLEVLHKYQWPGNVRELFNALESALINAHTEPTLFAMHLPADIRVKARRRLAAPGEPSGPLKQEPKTAREKQAPRFPRLRQVREKAICEAEQRYLLHLLQVAGGDMRIAAQLSGLSRSQIYRLLQKVRRQR